MFVRKKKNRSGSTSVVVVDKSGGRFVEIKCFGVSSSIEEIELLCHKAAHWIHHYSGQQSLNFGLPELRDKELEDTHSVISRIKNVLINGPQLILDQIYSRIGFDSIEDDILRHLVIARLCHPQSKVATVAYLKAHFDEDVDLFNIYRYMDKLYNTQRELVQQISVEHTRKLLGGRIGLLFYDVTTLYFETPRQDQLRQPGFSKDGKTSEAQIVLGLLVSAGGYPLSYSIFNGSQFEGRTMIPIVDDFVRRFSLDDFVIVADSGLMSSKNVELLRSAGYKYILGARIRNESVSVKQWILAQTKEDGISHELRMEGKERLILNYSALRAKKDGHNRQKGIERLRKAYSGGKLTKEHINKRGYNKFLNINKDVQVTINEDKIVEDAVWDGLKGYITNTGLSPQEVINQYHGLWVVERAFRISKGNLEMRPMFHFTEKRIEAHVCICFIAYKVYKELERVIKLLKLDISVDKALEVAKTITTIQINLPQNEMVYNQTLFITDQHLLIKPLFDLKTFLGDA